MNDPGSPLTEVAGSFWFGSAREIRAAPHRFPAEIALANGGLARFRLGRRSLVACASVEAVRHILVHNHENYPRSYHRRNAALILGNGLIFNEGDAWLRQRRMLLPGFRGHGLKGWNELISDHARSAMAHFDEAVLSGETLEMNEVAMRLSVTVIGSALFSRELTQREIVDFRGSIRESLRLVRARNVSPISLPPWFPSPANQRLAKVRAELDRFADQEIEARLKIPEPDRPHDFLKIILDAVDPESGAPMSDAYRRDEFKTLIVAGFETTANALTWALYLLAKHPEIADFVRTEAHQVLGEGHPSSEAVGRLALTTAVVHEAMRLYPPVYTIPRAALSDDVICGKQIRRGDVLLVSVFGAHRDPAVWDRPEEFLPARFLPGADWNRDAYLPFGLGKHHCLGATFAMAELVITLAEWTRHFEWSLPEDFVVGESAFVTLAPDHPIPLMLRRRT